MRRSEPSRPSLKSRISNGLLTGFSTPWLPSSRWPSPRFLNGKRLGASAFALALSLTCSLKLWRGRIPIWPYAKLVLLCWLSMPCFSGASYVYEHYLRPLMVNQQRVNLWYVPKGKDPSNQRDDIITAAEKYIQQHGSGELQYMLDNVSQILVLLSASPFNSHTFYCLN